MYLLFILQFNKSRYFSLSEPSVNMFIFYFTSNLRNKRQFYFRPLQRVANKILICCCRSFPYLHPKHIMLDFIFKRKTRIKHFNENIMFLLWITVGYVSMDKRFLLSKRDSVLHIIPVLDYSALNEEFSVCNSHYNSIRAVVT